MPPSQGENGDKIVKLNKEFMDLKDRCAGYERVIKDLEARCDTHENALEMLPQEIVCLHVSQGTLSASYNGEKYDLLP
jgi:hypothetical protein